MAHHPKRTPEELAYMRDLIAQGKTSNEVADVMGIAQKSVLALALHHKLGPWKHYHGRFERPSKEDLAKAMDGRPTGQVAAEYKVSVKTIYTWAKAYGISRRPGSYKRIPKPPVERQEVRETLAYAFSMKPDGYIRDTTPAGLAAEYFRHDRQVIRCDREGRPSQGGRFWRCGTRIMTDAEIIDAAAEKKARDARLFGRRVAA